MKLRLNTLLATALCLSAIEGLEEPIFLTQGNPETDDLPDEVAQAILDSEHGHCLSVVEPKVDVGLSNAANKDAEKTGEQTQTSDEDAGKDNPKAKAKAH
jgi:hypothetical protein